MEYAGQYRSFLEAIAGEMRLGFAVRSTYTASTKNANGLGFILAMPTFHSVMVLPNDPSSATRPMGRVDCNPDAMVGFAEAHGWRRCHVTCAPSTYGLGGCHSRNKTHHARAVTGIQ